MDIKKTSVSRKALSIILTMAMVSSVVVSSAVSSVAVTNDKNTSDATTTVLDTAINAYGLQNNPQDGVILHAWDWSLQNIKEQLPNIAKAGYTTVQTSVLQHCKEATVGKLNSGWWVYYQPASFVLDTTEGYSALGTKADLESLCEEADKYDIKIIVDVVANHLGNQSGYDKSTAIPSDIRDDSTCWHSEGFTEINYSSRYSITHGSMGGLPDLNTESTKIQNYVKTYLRECIDCGVDGFRFDAAKHISVPSEGSEYTFWSNVIPDANSYYSTQTGGDSLFCYGEILGDTGGPAMTSYTEYMSVTDDVTSRNIRNSVTGSSASGAAASSYNKGVSASKIVLWAESHDTYAGDAKETTDISTSNLNKIWAMVGSRNNATALYFARPVGYGQGVIGSVGSTACFNTEVAAVNKFHNAFAGQSEYLAYSGNIAYNERGTSGVVIVNVSGTSTSVNLTANKMASGTYTDQITGNTFTVSGGKISGTIGSTGIAVVYNAEPTTGIYATPGNEDGIYSYRTDSVTVTLNAIDMTNPTYAINGGTQYPFTDGMRIVLGAEDDFETVNTLTLTGTYSDGTTTSKEYTFYKTNQSIKIYFDKSAYSSWSSVYAYIYIDDETNLGAWPGLRLTNISTLSGYYYYELPEGYENAYVIWSDNGNSSRRYPGSMEPGLEVNSTTHLFSGNNTWIEYSETEIPTNPPTDPVTDPVTDPPTNPENTYVVGDASGDGIVNMKDCIIIQRATLGTVTLSGKNLAAADVTGDNNISLQDVILVMRYVIGYNDGSSNVGTVVTYEEPTNPPTDPVTDPVTDPPTNPPTDPPTNPPTDPPTVAQSIVYFNPTAIAEGNERWAIYTWKGTSNTWVNMTGSGNLYQAALPTGYTNFVITRISKTVSTNSWSNVWNQTDNLTYSTTKNLVTATGWGSGNLFNVTQSKK